MIPHFSAVVIVISCRAEWLATLANFPNADIQVSPLGHWFAADIIVRETSVPVVFFNGGWGKISASASTQYIAGRWRPALIVNLGTCGGFRGEVDCGDILLVDRTIAYDIVERLTDFDSAIAAYTTELDLSWLGNELPQSVRRTTMVSADRDLDPIQIPWLKSKFGAVAADWESASIAWVAARNCIRCLILRGVSDLVGEDGGEAYHGNIDVYLKGTSAIMTVLLKSLPDWLTLALPDTERYDFASEEAQSHRSTPQ